MPLKDPGIQDEDFQNVDIHDYELRIMLSFFGPRFETEGPMSVPRSFSRSCSSIKVLGGFL